MADAFVRTKKLIGPNLHSIGEVLNEASPLRPDAPSPINDPIRHRTAAANLPSAILNS